MFIREVQEEFIRILLTERIRDEKIDKAWKAVILENQYIRVTILPQLGGRILRAYDKTNDYDLYTTIM